ncbi:zinc-binding dehydrogenase [Streptomyces tubercidicus]|uniref:zinc-binding dehydrogenase n=1 Tax=Streptomyces tubercidicus TaxID=47759 RepID=UPI003693B9F2
MPIPQDIPFTVASMFGCAVLTGAGAVINTAALRPGQSAVVYGLGGVGLSAVLGACAAGAYPVIAVDPVPEKRELALQLGATHAYDPAEAIDAVRELTDATPSHAAASPDSSTCGEPPHAGGADAHGHPAARRHQHGPGGAGLGPGHPPGHRYVGHADGLIGCPGPSAGSPVVVPAGGPGGAGIEIDGRAGEDDTGM